MATKHEKLDPVLEAAWQVGRLRWMLESLNTDAPNTPERNEAVHDVRRQLEVARLGLRRAVNDPTTPID